MSIRIMGKYEGLAPEEIDTAETQEEAQTLLDEYKMAYGSEWQLWIEDEDDLRFYRYNPREICKRCGGYLD
jgi:hypothetical protein